MKVIDLNSKIIIEKNSIVKDKIGNHKAEWKEFYLCKAKAKENSGYEKNVAGNVVEKTDISFIVRFCKKTSLINQTEYRIRFNKEIYNIVFIDHMSYKNRYLKFLCKKVKR